MRDAFARVVPGPRDVAALRRLRDAGMAPEPSLVEQDYTGRVVQKPWGFEFLAFDTSDAAVWRLRINAGHSTSMHCHPRKQTALLVLAGQALCHTFGRRFTLGVHDVIVLEAGVFHATKATAPEGLDLLEVETPRCKTDLVRLDDLYGRAGAAYEGISEMQTERLERFDYFSLHGAPADGGRHHVDARQRFRLGVHSLDAAALRTWRLQPGARALFVLHGQIDDRHGRRVAGVGDALPPGALASCEPGSATPLLVLSLEHPLATSARALVAAAAPVGLS